MTWLVDSILNAVLGTVNFFVRWANELKDRRDDDLITAVVRSRKRRLTQLLCLSLVVTAAAMLIESLPAGRGSAAPAIEHAQRWVPILAACTLAPLLAAMAYCIYSIRRLER